jgi:hypothetical protein
VIVVFNYKALGLLKQACLIIKQADAPKIPASVTPKPLIASDAPKPQANLPAPIVNIPAPEPKPEEPELDWGAKRQLAIQKANDKFVTDFQASNKAPLAFRQAPLLTASNTARRAVDAFGPYAYYGYGKPFADTARQTVGNIASQVSRQVPSALRNFAGGIELPRKVGNPVEEIMTGLQSDDFASRDAAMQRSRSLPQDQAAALSAELYGSRDPNLKQVYKDFGDSWSANYGITPEEQKTKSSLKENPSLKAYTSTEETKKLEDAEIEKIKKREADPMHFNKIYTGTHPFYKDQYKGRNLVESLLSGQWGSGGTAPQDWEKFDPEFQKKIVETAKDYSASLPEQNAKSLNKALDYTFQDFMSPTISPKNDELEKAYEPIFRRAPSSRGNLYAEKDLKLPEDSYYMPINLRTALGADPYVRPNAFSLYPYSSPNPMRPDFAQSLYEFLKSKGVR